MLQLLILTDLQGHLIDHFGQFTDFIIVLGLDLNTITAVCNFLCLVDNITQRKQNGTDIVITAQNHNE